MDERTALDPQKVPEAQKALKTAVTKPRTKKSDRSRSKSVIITGPSITVNKKIYGASAMTTTYASSMKLPNKEKVQEICAEAYMKLLCLFTSNDNNEDNEEYSGVK